MVSRAIKSKRSLASSPEEERTKKSYKAEKNFGKKIFVIE
jgi:hypothetical protein